MKFVDTTGRVEKFQKKYNWGNRKEEAKTPPKQRPRSPAAIHRAPRLPFAPVRTAALTPDARDPARPLIPMWQRFEQADPLPRAGAAARRPRRDRRPRAASPRSPRSTAASPSSSSPYLEFKLGRDRPEAEALLAAETDPDMRATPRRSWPPAPRRRPADRLEDLLLVDPARTSTASSWKSAPAPAATRRPCSPATSTTCTPTTPATKGWKVEDISFSPGEQGGFKEVVFSVTGDEVYQHLRYESGGHRVQRVPKTETQGRIHTSAATVAVLPEPDEAQVEVKDSDIEWERMRAGGAGGQHVNKTESAVRIWYKRGTPDEMEVKCQDERSQHKNYERAMRILRSRLLRAAAAEAAQRAGRAAPHR